MFVGRVAAEWSCIRHFVWIFVLPVMLGLAGCNGTPNSPETATLAGTVLSSGVALKDAVVVAMHRSTNQRFETTTDASGHFQMEVDTGPYDVGYFHRDTSTAFVGPVLAGKDERVVNLEPIADSTAQVLSGQITDPQGVPLSGVTVTLHGNRGNESGFPDHVSTTSDTSGWFRFDGIPQGWLNVIITGNQVKQKEIVDIFKHKRLCKVTLAVNTGHLNGWQPDMISDDDPPDEDDLQISGDLESGGMHTLSGTFPCTITPTIPIAPDGTWYLMRGCGTGQHVTVEGQMHEIEAEGECPLPACWSMRVFKRSSGRWCCRYRVEMDLPTKSSIGVYFKFTDNDKSPDTYRLSVFQTMTHHEVDYDCLPWAHLNGDAEAAISKVSYDD